MHQFHKFILARNSTCFGQFLCPSSGVYSLYTQQWYMSYRFVDKPVWHIPFLVVQWINSWWWTEELCETRQNCMTYTIAECTVNELLMMDRLTVRNMCQNKFVKIVHLVGFIIKKFVTTHGHMNVKKKQEKDGGIRIITGCLQICVGESALLYLTLGLLRD